MQIDSSQRNRNLHPHPSKFSIAASSRGMSQGISILDAVSDMAFVFSWTGNLFDQTISSPTLNCTVVTPSTDVTSLTDNHSVFLSPTNSGAFRAAENYYRGATFVFSGGRRRIASSKLVFTNLLMLTFDEVTNASGSVQIQDPTNVAQSVFFVPSGRNFDFYQSRLVNETRGTSVAILNYWQDESVLQTSGSTAGWSNGDNFYVAKFDCQRFVVGTALPSQIQILGNVSQQTDAYAGHWLYIPTQNPKTDTNVDLWRRITAYSAGRQTVTVSPSFPVAPSAGLTAFMWEVRTDNCVPMCNMGPFHAAKRENRDLIYRVRLANMSLPNVPLSVGKNTSDLSVVHVEFEPTPCGDSNPVYLATNQLKLQKTVFVAAVPSNLRADTPFINLASDVTNVLVWRPTNGGLCVSVKLPDGSLLVPKQQDSVAPFAPLPHLQMSFLIDFEPFHAKKP